MNAAQFGVDGDLARGHAADTAIGLSKVGGDDLVEIYRGAVGDQLNARGIEIGGTNFKGTARDGLRGVALIYQPCERQRRGRRLLEERNRAAKGAEEVAARAEIESRSMNDLPALPAPHPHRDVGNVEAAGAVQGDFERGGVRSGGRYTIAGSDAAYIDGPVEAREGALLVFPIAAAAQIGVIRMMGPDIAQAEVGNEALELLNHNGGAAGDVVGQLLHGQERSLAAAVADGVGHLGAAVGAAEGDGVDGIEADQLADVGNGPGRAGLNELIVVELPHVLANDGGLALQDREECFKLAALQGVAGAEDRRQQRIDGSGSRCRAHGHTPTLPWEAGSSSRTSAPAGGDSVGCGPEAQRMFCTAAGSPLRLRAVRLTAMTPGTCCAS